MTEVVSSFGKENKMKNIVFDAGHIFHHYLECSIPEEEWKRMTVEQALQIAMDVAHVLDHKMSPADFGDKYKLPRS
jgi:hypothetical protein